jgi:lysozyme family protein
MSTITLSAGLRAEYEHLFHGCRIRPARTSDIDRTVDRLAQHRVRYDGVSGASGVPWHVIGVIHCMETGLRFDRHLHNGDPLTQRTRQVPAGHPRGGTPPFAWEESAQDALALKRLGPRTDWSLAGTLYQLERYNGWGYRRYRPHVLTPYLWSFSQHYTQGKYVADGRWSDTAVSQQCGAAVLLRRLAERELIVFEDQPPPPPTETLLVSWSKKKPTDADTVARAEALQRWLNTFPGIFVRVDGHPGDRTSEAYRKVTGVYLPDDPRAA